MESMKEKIEYPMSQLPGGGQTPQSTTLHVLLLTAGYRSSTEASSVCRRAIITTATFHPYIINLAIVFLIISLFFFFLAETNIYKLQQIKISSLLLYNQYNFLLFVQKWDTLAMIIRMIFLYPKSVPPDKDQHQHQPLERTRNM